MAEAGSRSSSNVMYPTFGGLHCLDQSPVMEVLKCGLFIMVYPSGTHLGVGEGKRQ